MREASSAKTGSWMGVGRLGRGLRRLGIESREVYQTLGLAKARAVEDGLGVRLNRSLLDQSRDWPPGEAGCAAVPGAR
jgi:hypothetical protein